MKKVYLFVSGILLTGATTHAQISAEKAYQSIQKLDGTPRIISLSSDDRAPGDNLARDDFSAIENRNIYTLDGTTPIWEIVTTEPASMGGYIDTIASTTEAIGQNQPNPFGDNALINYELSEATNVSVKFVDISGKEVETINNGIQEAGTYTLDINANDFVERVYFYTFTVRTEKSHKREW